MRGLSLKELTSVFGAGIDKDAAVADGSAVGGIHGVFLWPISLGLTLKQIQRNVSSTVRSSDCILQNGIKEEGSGS